MVRMEALSTPNFIVDLDILEHNIKAMGDLVKQHGKQLCPMVKTHKCTEMALMQQNVGYATSFLAGTLKEAEKMADAGIQDIMMAYPTAGDANFERIKALIKKTHLVIPFDGIETAQLTEAALSQDDLTVDYVIIVDCGLHRLGIEAQRAGELATQIAALPHLKFLGITSHPGHVYGMSGQDAIAEAAHEEIHVLETAKKSLEQAGFAVKRVATGCTPTAIFELQSDVVDFIRPGNYVFNDTLQVALGVVPEERCSLTVLATVTAHPAADRFIIDAGTKCFGLDQGAHNISLVKGFGIVKNHPELELESLSEEVGKIKVHGATDLKVGDKLQVIPNHACVCCNMTSYVTGVRKGVVEKRFFIDARGGVND